MRRIVIFAATSRIAEHCARCWVADEAVEIDLVGREEGPLQEIADDLAKRSSRSKFHIQILEDFTDPEAIANLADELVARGPIDLVFIAQGNLPDQKKGQDDLAYAAASFRINALSPFMCAEAFAKVMKPKGGGQIAVIGSVAGDRGRKSNYIYGAAKAALACYLEGMQHRFVNTNIQIILIKPGPTDTPMARQADRQHVKPAPVEKVARNIVNAIAQGQQIIYVPRRWRLIMFVIRHLPRWILFRLDI